MLIQTGTSPGLVILNDPPSLGTAVASYGVWNGSMLIAGGGGFVAGVGGCFFSPTAGETAGTGELLFVAVDGGGAIVGHLDCQIVSYDPAVGPTGGDPWATPLPGAYALGEAGEILGTLKTTLPGLILDQANGVETGITPRNALRAMLAVLAGLVPNTGGTVIFQNPGGSKNRVTVTLGAGGKRTSVLFDFS